MARELTMKDLIVLAERAGLQLSADELQRLLPGVNRAKKQAAVLRDLIDSQDEPAAAFTVAAPMRK